MKLTHITVSALALIAASATVASARDQIRVTGSSTVFPYSQAVAEEFANQTGSPAPIVESVGTGGGFQAFCGGIGEGHPDLTGASRAIKKSEYDLCATNGVTDISEALIGNDGLAMSISRANTYDWDMTLGEMYTALAAQVPVDGEWKDNPYKNWNEINPAFPDVAITVYGPPPTSGTRDAWVEIAMHKGCEQLEFVKAGGFDGDWVEENCSRMRTDGPFIEAGENDNLIVQQLNANSNAMGIFGYSYLYENLDQLKGVKFGGIEPDFDTIAAYDYEVARPLYFYVKNAHRGVIPNLQEFIEEYMSDAALQTGGYLAERGMTPLPEAQRKEYQTSVLGAVNMEAPTE
ncbi:phosphate ABC transporter substrate-binding protein [Pseudotabrizicola sediminis]|uniref:Phosphate ABC transporter substrate-binding protein n=1 Tax=Pseudotabrizicola sediminis TaxID=2486418 RepID=A0ABY2KHG5_9RHOB|nr:substrate-binding domain-containing protein [Pseudotabrizicola sediminis]TGD41732.1 phosphate ABC transporter substrate-binding protein [Pseudotabrizicola sediminis]